MSQLITKGLLSSKLITQGYFEKISLLANGLVRIVGVAKSLTVSGTAKALKIIGIDMSLKIRGSVDE